MQIFDITMSCELLPNMMVLLMKRIEIEQDIENTQDVLDDLESVISELTDTHFHALITNRIYDLPILEERFRRKMAEARLVRGSLSNLKDRLAQTESRQNPVQSKQLKSMAA
jgi:hypothetical protein